MKVFLAHNHYQQPGGEDRSFAAEAALLEEKGHTVIRHTVHNDEIKDMPRWKVARSTVWNPEAYRTVASLLRREQPDVAHFNNTFPLLSPSVYYAARAAGVPTVQTLRNFRLFCLNGYFYRDGNVCMDCLGSTGPLPGVAHACYRSSHLESLGVAALQTTHRLAGTWTTMVDRYIALTPSARTLFVDAGLPADRIDLKPNFLRNPMPPGSGDGGYALFVGRLSPEKGVELMLEAWTELGDRLPLRVVGDGPLADRVRRAAAPGRIEAVGRVSPERVQALMGEATMLIFPSLWYETFGRVGMEALAAGTPVVASDHGAMADLIEHGRTGRLFQPGSATDLVEQVQWLLDHPQARADMRSAAREEFEAHYTGERNYQLLMAIYRRAQAGSTVGDANDRTGADVATVGEEQR